jgi:hypothetical protein
MRAPGSAKPELARLSVTGQSSHACWTGKGICPKQWHRLGFNNSLMRIPLTGVTSSTGAWDAEKLIEKDNGVFCVVRASASMRLPRS